MTKQISRMMALVAFAGLVVGATGCKCFCRTASSAEQLRIIRQPADTEVYLATNGRPRTATLSVTARAQKNLRFAWFKIVPIRNGYQEVLLTNRVGALSDVLKLEDVNTNDEGLYFCSIVHEAGDDVGDFFSRSRLAELKVYVPMVQALSTNVIGITQISSGTLAGINPGTNSCPPGKYGASISFSKDSSGILFTAPSTQGSTCNLSVSQVDAAGNLTPLTNDKFGVRWNTAKPSDTDCAVNGSTQLLRTFPVRQLGRPHAFVVYLVSPQSIGTKYQLKVEWN